MFQFATAWTTESITKTEPTQVLAYMWVEPEVIRVHHRCVIAGSWIIYCHFSLKWDREKEDKANEYFDQCKINGSDTRVDIEKTLKKVMDSEVLPVGWES